jgi:predicted membrane chloride channel (bestrophin family)
VSNFIPFRSCEGPQLSNSTVWIYLFFLPFQLVSQFVYYTIPGVAIAAFIYLGFIAAGEEIEQPFGAAHHVLFMRLNSFSSLLSFKVMTM